MNYELRNTIRTRIVARYNLDPSLVTKIVDAVANMLESLYPTWASAIGTVDAILDQIIPLIINNLLSPGPVIVTMPKDSGVVPTQILIDAQNLADAFATKTGTAAAKVQAQTALDVAMRLPGNGVDVFVKDRNMAEFDLNPLDEAGIDLAGRQAQTALDVATSNDDAAGQIVVNCTIDLQSNVQAWINGTLPPAPAKCTSSVLSRKK